jgi:hypothetical protein
MSHSGRPLPGNVYNKNVYFSGNGVKTSSVSAETNALTTSASEIVKLKYSTRCLLDRPADGYNRKIQTEADQIPVWVEYLHRSPGSRRRPQKRSLENETVKYGRES